VLLMAAGTRALSCRGILAPQEMQKVRRLQFRHAISSAGFVDQKRKGDARFFAKYSRIIAVAQSDRGKGGSFVAEGLLVFAQLRDVLAAKNSAIVAEKNQHGSLSGPQRAKSDFPPFAIGKGDLCEPAA
jgi:hypothetical protein